MGWGTPSFETVRTLSGLILYFGEGVPPPNAHIVDPWIINKFMEDDFENVSLRGSMVGRDINDMEGGMGALPYGAIGGAREGGG